MCLSALMRESDPNRDAARDAAWDAAVLIRIDAGVGSEQIVLSRGLL